MTDGTLTSKMLGKYEGRVQIGAPRTEGQVTQILGMLLDANAAGAAVGDLYRIRSRQADVMAEVVALKGSTAVMVPYGQVSGLRVGDRMLPEGGAASIGVSDAMLGRVIDVLGNPLDGGPRLPSGQRLPVYADPLPPNERRPIDQRIGLGVRSLDAFVPCGRGQRLGIFAGAGVGKSSILGMIARFASADVAVLALVGERGREVGHFVDEVLGAAGLKRSVVVVATSDRPPSERVRAAFVATTVAEYFRDQGKDVLLFVDSLTRFVMAQREVGLSIGEPPTTKGYPPSTFSMMPKLLERAAPRRGAGSITGLFTVLVEGDDMSDPVADAAKGLLDGHIALSRDLASRGHFPAVDVLQSLSRLENEISEPQVLQASRTVRGWLGRIEDARDLIAVGAYQPGADRELDLALSQSDKITAFLCQDLEKQAEISQTDGMLQALAKAQGLPPQAGGPTQRVAMR